ncbi:hypothetical protein D1AOALGA4SA_6369 [Olavius algarvensis Delta 1 endosymbiont]|nr:hypothetical protein D1AOALGA4SA_6369 [Olavius algarvensis Delta 1 endosymbiont]
MAGSSDPGIGYWALGNGYWVLGIGYWVLDTGYWILDAGYRVKLVFGLRRRHSAFGARGTLQFFKIDVSSRSSGGLRGMVIGQSA